ncbi:MAG: RsmB/NOP family class I SAM-dependent RNA methyltransferase [Sphingomonadales bacterium]
MKPAARIQTTIDLLGAIEAETLSLGLPADRVVRNFFRERRFAGSKDRAAITGLAYEVLRHKARLMWRVGQVDGALKTRPRALVIAALLDLHGLDFSSVFEHFSGAGYGPVQLDDAEAAMCRALTGPSADAPAMPDWARLDYPDWMDQALRSRFGPDLEPELNALNQRAAVDIRVNTLRLSRDKVAGQLRDRGIESDLCPWSPTGLRVPGRARVNDLDLFRQGAIEFQDEGAQIASLMCDPRSGMQVVDLCAGAGGKSLAMAAIMTGKGQLHAFDRETKRLRALEKRLRRADVRNVQLGGRPEGGKFEALVGRADRVILDVPCGGSGTWRRNPDLKWRYGVGAIDEFATRQRELLDQGARLVKKGGRLIYVTCSVLEQENEEQVRDFLAANPAFSLIPYQTVWRDVTGTEAPDSASNMSECLQLTPCRHGTDGFFIAVLERLDSKTTCH